MQRSNRLFEFTYSRSHQWFLRETFAYQASEAVTIASTPARFWSSPYSLVGNTSRHKAVASAGCLTYLA